MYYRGREDFRTRFQSVVLTADKVLKLKTSRFILGYHPREQLVQRQLFVFQSWFALLVYINFVWKHIWCYTREYFMPKMREF